MTVQQMLTVTCDESGVRVSLPINASFESFKRPDYHPKAPIRWWVQRWGWMVDEGGRDICPDHTSGEDSARSITWSFTHVASWVGDAGRMLSAPIRIQMVQYLVPLGGGEEKPWRLPQARHDANCFR